MVHVIFTRVSFYCDVTVITNPLMDAFDVMVFGQSNKTATPREAVNKQVHRIYFYNEALEETVR